ncbi:Smp-30/Cgr1 family protein [Oceanicola granulosus HTCC2516]|uniref:Smp-30/Cgr1 family protein n=1 Tax=Oceanicola granulosus (strain ATCC BAA-861 / DSM 15982 / KCTC 12143 / HTCC2516) TaxID=314256 RepID=Q2CB41_OCEGH|nr:SMP-30/gluconolactonase/LRE family protein [Oceanicola granulosus]EAR49889.1 Smp-30/Cgr1 family protein [Oceanicola granulosus HTCC2516]
MRLHDETCCTLGEGPLWHPGRDQLFWFDILSKRLHTRGQSWEFEHCVSAAGWVADDKLLMASAVGLHLFDIDTGTSEDVCAMEADDSVTRSNDGRADPRGGFWIGTMGMNAEDGAGAIYRFHKGELRRLYPGISIPNAICFAPDGRFACFADTPSGQVMRVALDGEGWPDGEPEVFVDMNEAGLKPDGAVFDSDGNLWCAQFGAGRVSVYGTDGALKTFVGLPAAQTTCPAFGGEGRATLFVTSAAVGLSDALNPHHGRTFAVETTARGQAEHQVRL